MTKRKAASGNVRYIALMRELYEKEGSYLAAAEVIGCNRGYVHQVLNGRCPTEPKSESWQALYDALGMDPSITPELEKELAIFTSKNADIYNRLAAWLRNEAKKGEVEAVLSVARAFGWKG